MIFSVSNSIIGEIFTAVFSPVVWTTLSVPFILWMSCRPFHMYALHSSRLLIYSLMCSGVCPLYAFLGCIANGVSYSTHILHAYQPISSYTKWLGHIFNPEVFNSSKHYQSLKLSNLKHFKCYSMWKCVYFVLNLQLAKN